MDQTGVYTHLRPRELNQLPMCPGPLVLRPSSHPAPSAGASSQTNFDYHRQGENGFSTRHSATNKMQRNLLKTIDDSFSARGQNRTSRLTEFADMKSETEQPSPPICCWLSLFPREPL